MKAFPKFGPKDYERMNKIAMKQSNLEFAAFKSKFNKGICYICRRNLSVFDASTPCMHWFLNPKGLKKKHIPFVLGKFDYNKIQPFLRWIASTETPFGNINDLVEERSSKKVIENTIKYKNLEWSFSSSKNDFNGIPDSRAGGVPHYHFQMRIGGMPYIDYSDYHIPFTKYDQWVFDIQNDKFEDLKHRSGHAMGMQDLLIEVAPDDLINAMTRAEDEENAIFSMSTIIEADPGSGGIASEDINFILKEHREKGVPIAKLVKDLKNVHATTFITPGEGVPKIAARKGGKGSRKNKKNE